MIPDGPTVVEVQRWRVHALDETLEYKNKYFNVKKEEKIQKPEKKGDM